MTLSGFGRWTASEAKMEDNLAKVGAWYGAMEAAAQGRLGRWEHGRRRTLPGWFAQTLPAAPAGPIAFLRCDADMYSSTLECLTHLYPRVAEGGLVYVDDYHEFEACRRAVDEFRAANGIEWPMLTILEDAEYHFVPLLSPAQVAAHKASFPRGHPSRHIDAVFWRKG